MSATNPSAYASGPAPTLSMRLSCPPSCQRTLSAEPYGPTVPAHTLSGWTAFASGYRPQVPLRTTVPTTGLRILLASPGPVNSPAVFFPQVVFRPFRTGCGEDGIRTRYPLLAKQVLYRLSYFPSFSSPHVRVPGFEPGTSALSELRSSQLSYTRGRRSLETQEPNHSGLALSANRIPGES